MSGKPVPLRQQVLALESRTRVLEHRLAGRAKNTPAFSSVEFSAMAGRLALIERVLGVSPEPMKTIRLEDQ